MLTHFNHGYSAGVPLGVGDTFYAQDLSRDFNFMTDWATKGFAGIMGKPALMWGGVVTFNGGTRQVNVTAGGGIVDQAVTVTDGSQVWAIPPVTRSDVSGRYVSWVTQTNLDLSALGMGTTPAAGTWYLWAQYSDSTAGLNQRARTRKAGSYYFELAPSVTFVANQVASPGSQFLLLATLTVAGNVITATNQAVNAASLPAVKVMVGNANPVAVITSYYSAMGSGSATDGVFYVYGNNSFHLMTNGVDRIVVTGGGIVGINRIPTTDALEVSGGLSIWAGGTRLAYLSYSAGDSSIIGGAGVGSLIFMRNSVEKMRIDPNDYLLLGYTASQGAYKLQVSNTLFVGGSRNVTLSATGSVNIQGSAGSWDDAYRFTGSAGTSMGGFGAYGSSDTFGYYYIGLNYSTTYMYTTAVRTGFYRTPTMDTLEIAGQVSSWNGTFRGASFVTNATGDALFGNASNYNLLFIRNGAEKMRIDTNDYLLLGYTTSQGGYKLQVNGTVWSNGGYRSATTNGSLDISDGGAGFSNHIHMTVGVNGKYIRVDNANYLSIVNAAFSAQIFGLNDAGNLWVSGTISPGNAASYLTGNAIGIGVGRTAATYAFEVQGDSYATGALRSGGYVYPGNAASYLTGNATGIGVGRAVTTYAFEVAGDIYATGTLRGSGGNVVLTSNRAGTWTTGSVSNSSYTIPAGTYYVTVTGDGTNYNNIYINDSTGTGHTVATSISGNAAVGVLVFSSGNGDVYVTGYGTWMLLKIA